MIPFIKPYLDKKEEQLLKLQQATHEEAEKALQMAETERKRHEMRYPLREFVMQNYNLVPTRTRSYIFRRKESSPQGG